MAGKIAPKWPMGSAPCISAAIPERMDALTIRRDDYGPPSRAIQLEDVAVPRLHPAVSYTHLTLPTILLV